MAQAKVMAPLTRRLINRDHQTWEIMCGDVAIGTIGLRSGQPTNEPAWRWVCGFYPGLEPGQHQDGVTDTFEKARAEFQKAWEYVQAVMPADAFEQYREWREHDRIRMQRIKDGWIPPPFDGWMTCVCGARFNERDPAHSREHVPHIEAARRRSDSTHG